VQLRWFLTLASIVLLVVAGTVVIHDKLSDDDTSTATTLPGDTTITTSGAPGAVQVAGKVTSVRLTGAVLDPRILGAPFTMTATRGFGNGAQLPNVRVNGAISNINWDGGRPFVLSSGPGIELDPITVDLTPDGLRLLVGDTAATFIAGTYQLDTPVAVGGASTTPTEKDAVTFDVRDGDGAQLQPTGDANIVLPPSRGPLHVKGPGRVHLEGSFTVTVDGKRHSAKSVDLRTGPYELVFTPSSGGSWVVSGEVQPQGDDVQLGAPALAGHGAEVR
jgi:hypothetical protein